MNEQNKPARCQQCPYIGLNTELQYFPVYYCKFDGRELHFSSAEGWDRMKWCPLCKDGEGNG